MASSKEDNSFKSLIKGTSVFGGVQIFQILISLIRGKFVAVLLGPDGMGVNSLYTSSAAFIQQLASLGINLSIVKEIASDNNNTETSATTVRISLKLIFYTSILGLVICVLGSPFLSKLSFGDYSHTLEYAFLSLMVFFTIATAGLSSILQGFHVIKILSKTTLFGSSVGLVVGVPLYYFFGVKGIVPSMIIFSIATFLFNLRGLLKTTDIIWEPIDLKPYKEKVKTILRLGLVLVVGALIGTSLTYILNIIIREFGTIESVGYYQSANSITNQYVGVIFAAMSLDYFPRLSSISNDNGKISSLVNRQLIVTCTLMAPLLCLLIITAPVVIKLLLAEKFLVIIPLVRWLAFGLIFRGLCYPLGYITFAKGNEKRFFVLEGITGNIINYGISIFMFLHYGLIGLGISLSLVYSIYFFILLFLNHKWYEYSMDAESIKVALFSCVIVALCFASSLYTSSFIGIFISTCIFFISVLFSYKIIRKNYTNQNN